MQAYTVVVLTVTVILVKSPAEALPCQSFTRGGGGGGERSLTQCTVFERNAQDMLVPFWY